MPDSRVKIANSTANTSSNDAEIDRERVEDQHAGEQLGRWPTARLPSWAQGRSASASATHRAGQRHQKRTDPPRRSRHMPQQQHQHDRRAQRQLRLEQPQAASVSIVHAVDKILESSRPGLSASLGRSFATVWTRDRVAAVRDRSGAAGRLHDRRSGASRRPVPVRRPFDLAAGSIRPWSSRPSSSTVLVHARASCSGRSALRIHAEHDGQGQQRRGDRQLARGHRVQVVAVRALVLGSQVHPLQRPQDVGRPSGSRPRPKSRPAPC